MLEEATPLKFKIPAPLPPLAIARIPSVPVAVTSTVPLAAPTIPITAIAVDPEAVPAFI